MMWVDVMPFSPPNSVLLLSLKNPTRESNHPTPLLYPLRAASTGLRRLRGKTAGNPVSAAMAKVTPATYMESTSDSVSEHAREVLKRLGGKVCRGAPPPLCLGLSHPLLLAALQPATHT